MPKRYYYAWCLTCKKPISYTAKHCVDHKAGNKRRGKRDVIIAYLARKKEFPLVDIAKAFGVTKQRVDQIVHE